MIFEICKRAYAINLYWLKAIMYASPNLMWMLANFIVTSQIPTQCIYLYILINMNLRLMQQQQQQQFVAYINKYNKFLVFQWIVTSFLFSSTKSYCNLLHPTYYKYIYIINANNWSVLGDWIRLNCKRKTYPIFILSGVSLDASSYDRQAQCEMERCDHKVDNGRSYCCCDA